MYDVIAYSFLMKVMNQYQFSDNLYFDIIIRIMRSDDQLTIIEKLT